MSISPTPPSNLSRRKLLAGVAAAGVTAALGDALVTYAPWLDYNAQARQTWNTPFRTDASVPAQMREMVRYATLAASGHNAQPWKFAILGDTIHILPDYSRRLPSVDPQDRELWISLGCALENLAIAAQYAGYETEIAYPARDTDFIAIRLRAVTARVPAPLAGAILHRQNTRSLYDGRDVPPAELKMIASVKYAPGLSLHIITAANEKEAVLEYVKAGNQRQHSDPAFLNELVAWLRFNKPEALHSLDGLYTQCSGSPQIPRWIGRQFVMSGGAGRQNATDERDVRSSSGLLVIAAPHDDKQNWIKAGRLYERLALTMTTLNIKTAFLNQPLEVAGLRAQFQSHLNLGAAQPQLLLRFGYADAMPPSLRRPVEQTFV